MPIPWAAILTHGPHIVAAAQALLTSQTKRPAVRQPNIDARIDALEKASIESARLLQGMAEQLQALTLAQQHLRRQVRLLLLVSGAALLLAVALLVVVGSS